MVKRYALSLMVTFCCLINLQKVLAQNNSNVTSEEKSFKPYGTWSKNMVSAYKKIANGPTLEVADILLKASDSMPQKNWENYLLCATIYSSYEEVDKAFVVLNKVIISGFRDVEFMESLPPLENLRKSPKWSEHVELVRAEKEKYEKGIADITLLKALKNMWDEDQKALGKYNEAIQSFGKKIDIKTNDSLFKPVVEIWNTNRKKLDSIIAIHGWPGNKLVGEDGAKLAWAIPQHHPDVFFKLKCLELIWNAVERGDVNPNYYAELHDRIARDTWQKQKYGASMDENGPIPIESPEEVNRRRWDLGLPEPVEVYSAYHGFEYKKKSKEEIRSAYQTAQGHYSKFENFLESRAIDSANQYIRKAIHSNGDISNKQLFEASIGLVKTGNLKSKRISLGILKVLAWRKWTSKHLILESEVLRGLEGEEEWENIKKMLER